MMRKNDMRILRLRLEIEKLAPAVWRTIDIASDIKLPDLHRVIQAVLGWRGEYPACFVSASGTYPVGDWPEPGDDASDKMLEDMCEGSARGFYYDYEPYDPWRVRIHVESDRLPGPGEELHSVCLDGERAAPPDGVGGHEGYADFLRMLEDPDIDEDEEDELEDMLEWAGGDFDPSHFDLEAANRRLKALPKKQVR